VAFEWGARAVPGPYALLYRLIPGYDALRKVSRIAAVASLLGAVLAGFGMADVLRVLRNRRARVVATALPLALLAVELRNAPLALVPYPAHVRAPACARWLATRPGTRPIAYVTDDRSAAARTLVDHEALVHGRRTLNGWSSWVPPVTRLFDAEMRVFPSRSGLDLLHALDAEWLVARLDRRSEALAAFAAAHPGEIVPAWQDGACRVYEVRRPDGPPGVVRLPLPPRPSAQPIPSHGTTIRTHSHPERARWAIDGDRDTAWDPGRTVQPGDFLELTWPEPRTVAALELDPAGQAMRVPRALRLWARDDRGAWSVVLDHATPRLYDEQIHAPGRFVLRLVPEPPVVTNALRVEVVEPWIGRAWVVAEATVWSP
jgi:hypothetical protein